MQHNLTKIQAEILKQLLQDKTTLEIAKTLKVTEKYVLTNLDRIQDKFCVSSHNGIIIEACRRGVIKIIAHDDGIIKIQQFEQEALVILKVAEKYLSRTTNVAFLSLMRHSGYVMHCEVVDEFLIRHVLLKNRKYLEVWNNFANNSEAAKCFLEEKRDKSYVVGAVLKGTRVEFMYYLDYISACAFYIKCELEFHRRTNGKPNQKISELISR